MLYRKNKEFTYKIQTIFWEHIEYKIYSETQMHKYFDLSVESSALPRCAAVKILLSISEAKS